MAAECVDKLAIPIGVSMRIEWVSEILPGVPELGVVVPACTGNESAIRRKRDMVHLLLVTQHTCDRLGALRRIPEVHGEIVTGSDQALSNSALESGCLFEPLLGLGSLPFLCLGHGCVIVECSPQDEIC